MSPRFDLICAHSYQLLGMAHVGLAPKVFGRRSKRFGTPLNAILLQLTINAMLVGLDFDAIMVSSPLARTLARTHHPPPPATHLAAEHSHTPHAAHTLLCPTLMRCGLV